MLSTVTNTLNSMLGPLIDNCSGRTNQCEHFRPFAIYFISEIVQVVLVSVLKRSSGLEMNWLVTRMVICSFLLLPL